MPNHVHALISFTEAGQLINTIIGNGKRFMAYEIIRRLKENNETGLLAKLAGEVELKRKQHNKQHEVWELSFDWKDCHSSNTDYTSVIVQFHWPKWLLYRHYT